MLMMMMMMMMMIIIIRPRRSRSTASSNFPVDDLSVCTYVCRSVGLSSALWKNGGSDLDAVYRRRSDGSSYEAGSAVWESVRGQGTFGALLCNQWGLCGVRVQQRRDTALFPNYFGQTCYYDYCLDFLPNLVV